MEDAGLHNLRPAAGATKARKRVGRGPASGTGKTSGRGHKGQKARAGSHYMPAGFEGGQMPLHMRIGKLRGSTKKMSMPMGPFRTRTQSLNVEKLSIFDKGTEVTPELLVQHGILRNLRYPVKVLGDGELTVALKVSADGFSKSAREKIEQAGGTVILLGGEPGENDGVLTHGRKPKGKAAKAAAAAAKEADKPGAKASARPAAKAADKPAEADNKPAEVDGQPAAKADAKPAEKADDTPTPEA